MKFEPRLSWPELTSKMLEKLSGGEINETNIRSVHSIDLENYNNIVLKLDNLALLEVIRRRTRSNELGQLFLEIGSHTHEVLMPDLEKTEACEFLCAVEKLPLLRVDDKEVLPLTNLKFSRNEGETIVHVMQMIEKALSLSSKSKMGTSSWVKYINCKKNAVFLGFRDQKAASIFTDYLKSQGRRPDYVGMQSVCGDPTLLGNGNHRMRQKANRKHIVKRLERVTQPINPFASFIQALGHAFDVNKPVMQSSSSQSFANEWANSSVVQYKPREAANTQSKILAFRGTSKAPYQKFDEAPRLIEDMRTETLPDKFQFEIDSPIIRNFCTVVASGNYNVQFHRKPTDNDLPAVTDGKDTNKHSSSSKQSSSKTSKPTPMEF